MPTLVASKVLVAKRKSLPHLTTSSAALVIWVAVTVAPLGKTLLIALAIGGNQAGEVIAATLTAVTTHSKGVISSTLYSGKVALTAGKPALLTIPTICEGIASATP